MKLHIFAIPLLFILFLFLFIFPNKILAIPCDDSIGGHCDVAFTCSDGLEINAECGAFQVCCPNTVPLCDDSIGGHCDTGVTCAQGIPLNGDCGAFQVCCSNTLPPCTSIDGHCDTAVTCAQGIPLNGECNAFQVCCSNTLPPCTSIDGHCDTAVTCSDGTPINGECAAFQVCCSNAATTSKIPPRNPEIFCTKGNPDSGIKTAIGCIPTGSSNELITTILKIATGIGGGIALALILYGTFIVTTSAGMPDKLKAGSEIITSAIIGLIFILLSVFLVNLIGINILGIPGLS